jgi:serine/threonine protein kinase
MPLEGPCPDTDALQRLANNQLSASEAFQLHRHLVRCPNCNQMVQALREASQVLTTPTTTTPSIPVAPVAAAPPPPSATPVTLVAPKLEEMLAPPQAPDEIGRLGGYRVLKTLGGGGMGIVFLAEDMSLRRKVALKAMRPQLVTDVALRKRFLHEARLAASLSGSDHIVTLHQVSEDRGIPFMAMEHLQGENLEDRLRAKKKLPIRDALQVGREVALGLAAAHERGLIHRDIKPSNIWLEAHGSQPSGFRVKLLDFGLARDAEAAAEHITQTGFVVGTAGYIAPEQARGKTADSRSDLFSLGCVLYECVTGVCPFNGTDAMSRLTALAVEDPIAPSHVNPKVPEKLSSAILWLLAKPPEKRPQTARAVVEAIEAIQREQADAAPTPAGKPTAEVGPTHPPEAGQASSSLLVILGIALAMMLAGIVGMLLFR